MAPKRKPVSAPVDDDAHEVAPKKKGAVKDSDGPSVSYAKGKRTKKETKQIKEEDEEDDVVDDDHGAAPKKKGAVKDSDGPSVSNAKAKRTKKETKQIKEEDEDDDATPIAGDDDDEDDDDLKVVPKKKRAAKGTNGTSVSEARPKRAKKEIKPIIVEDEDDEEDDVSTPDDDDDDDYEVSPKKKRAAKGQRATKARPKRGKNATKSMRDEDDAPSDDDDEDYGVAPKKKRVAKGTSVSKAKPRKTSRKTKPIKEENEEEEEEEEKAEMDAPSDDDDYGVVQKKKIAAKGTSVSKAKPKKTSKETKPIKDEDDADKEEEEEEEEKAETDAPSDDDDYGVVQKKKIAAKGTSVSKAKPKKTSKETKPIKDEDDDDKEEEEEEEEEKAETDEPSDDDDDDDDDYGVVQKKKRAAKGKSVSKAKSKKTSKETKSKKQDEDEEAKKEEMDVKTVVIKGRVPVDSYCTQKVDKAQVFCEPEDVWSAMLNQTNLQFNNNKFFLLQLLEDDIGKKYSVWFRWGRVGNKGQSKLHDCGSDLVKAKKTFKQKFQDKTKNSWDEKDSFVKVNGKYDLLQMDFSPTETKDEVDAPTETKLKIPASTLDQRVKALIELICNVKAMEEAVLEMKYDAKKAPLGKLTTEQIKAGYVALKEIEDLINKNAAQSELVQACNNFYTRIPHNFGMKVPPLIESKDDIIQKIQLLEALGDIQIAMKMLNTASDVLENPVDSHYKHLDCKLTPVEKDSEIFNVIKEYLLNSHEKTHNHYKMELEDVFECIKQDDDKKLNAPKNKMLLWHGSRLTNFVGILKQGLRIAPPEAPVTGYMFGKGVYFADRSSKSANYCCTTKSNNTGLLLLCEVSLGNVNELLQSDYNADKLPKGKHSVKGLGSIIPDPSNEFKLENGTIVPYGKGCSAPNTNGMTLNYNEYIVYDTNQIKMRYLVKVKFIYK